MQVAGCNINLNFILEGKARELVVGKYRWYDLKRTEKLLERVRQYNIAAALYLKECSGIYTRYEGH